MFFNSISYQFYDFVIIPNFRMQIQTLVEGILTRLDQYTD